MNDASLFLDCITQICITNSPYVRQLNPALIHVRAAVTNHNSLAGQLYT
jgi:hypothetical protein